MRCERGLERGADALIAQRDGQGVDSGALPRADRGAVRGDARVHDSHREVGVEGRTGEMGVGPPDLGVGLRRAEPFVEFPERRATG